MADGPSFSYEKKLVRELMTPGQISCTKILVRVSRTRNLDRLPSA